MKIMSCNIRISSADDGVNSWSQRKKICLEILVSQQAHILCFQEVEYDQMQDLQQAFPDFSMYGIPQTSSSRSFANVVLCERERFELISCNGFWLSETPHIPGSKSWNSYSIRSTTCLRLVDATTNKEFHLINTHLDHISQTAREQQARLLNENSEAFAKDFPQILTGDMNADGRNRTITYLKQHGWRDTYERIHGPEEPGATFHCFAGPAYKEKLKASGYDWWPLDTGKIDWIFTKGPVNVRDAHIIKDSVNGYYPSDHYFVSTDIDLSGS